MNKLSTIKTGFVGSQRLAALITAAALCSACATGAQRKLQAIRESGHVAISNMNTCVQAVYNSPDFAPLRQHFPGLHSQATLEQLTDPSFATDDEIKAIFAEHPKMSACRQQELDQFMKETPTFVPILASLYSRSEDAMIGLIGKKTTWGDYMRQVKALTEDSRTQLVAEGQRIDANLERSHEAELASRRAAANAITQFAQTQAAINALNRPVVTTCNSYGNSASCVTQ